MNNVDRIVLVITFVKVNNDSINDDSIRPITM